jgi:NAD(P)-dependent dehydrogenase (short-subunit alcohol dehydrogenase family)
MALLGNKVAIVTGCASGIGLATAKLFLSSGATVFGIDISSFPSPSPISSYYSDRFTFHQVNLLEPSAADDAVAACVLKYGRVDILANVAGVMDSYEAADTITDAQWERVMGINALVPMRLTRAVLNEGGMKARKNGSIINVASKSALSGAAAGSSYTASKHAVVRDELLKFLPSENPKHS